MTRLLEGSHQWGWVQIGTAGRGGWLILRLTVYPPGTDARERRLLTFARNWPAAWSTASVAAMVAGGGEAPAAVVVPLCTAIWAVGIVVVLRATRGIRARVRSVSVAQLSEGGLRRDLGDVAAVALAARELEGLDRAAAEGRIDPVEYERRWARVYEASFLADRSPRDQLMRRR